jgi:hypothetical protein
VKKKKGKHKHDEQVSAFDISNNIYFFYWLFITIKMDPALSTEEISETTPIKSEARRSSYFPVETAGQTFGTTYFLM